MAAVVSSVMALMSPLVSWSCAADSPKHNATAISPLFGSSWAPVVPCMSWTAHKEESQSVLKKKPFKLLPCLYSSRFSNMPNPDGMKSLQTTETADHTEEKIFAFQ